MTSFPAIEIMQFWFSDCVELPQRLQPVARRWYSGGESFDKEIQERFGHLFDLMPAYLLPEADDLDANELLGGILLFDQFSRNCFRRSAKAFAFDAMALQLMDLCLGKGLHQSMHPIHCVFLLMPLQHAEDLQRQHQGVELLQQLEQRAAEPYRAFVQGTTNYAREHRDLIARFGRFPHRNKVLARASSEEELRYLENGGNTYGQ